jgi:Protein of unknwon function (DUF3008)
MPATSKAQQAAAGIARAVEKGDRPASTLHGASKRMFKSMHGTGELHKFAHTKRAGLPQHVESQSLTARQMFERDDLMTGKAGHVEPETKSYARMTSKSVMDQPGGTANKWRQSLNLRKAITNQRGPLKGGKPGSTIFPAMDKAENTGGGKLGATKLKEGQLSEKDWIKHAINPDHKGYCTPMTKSTCTPRRKALAMRFKKGDIHKDNEKANESKAAVVVSQLLDD